MPRPAATLLAAAVGAALGPTAGRLTRRFTRYLLIALVIAAFTVKTWWDQQSTPVRLLVVLGVLTLIGLLVARRLDLRRGPGVALLPPPDGIGATYTLRDPEGRVRYHGSSGGLRRWASRIEEHVEARLLPIGPGWTCTADFHVSRAHAFNDEADRIDGSWGDPLLLNQRREGWRPA